LDLSSFLDSAEQIVRGAADNIKGFTGTNILEIKNYGDLVSEADLRIETQIMNAIKSRYPRHGFYSEEGVQFNTDAELVWILDPIDGTKYYTRRVPLYSISLALQRRERLVLGVVYSPESDQMFCAAEESSATLNGKEIHCSNRDELTDAIICAEFPSRHSHTKERDWAIRIFRLLIDHVQRVRIIGLGSLGLCWTALGGFDAYVNLGSGTKLWDIAAGQVILKAAGGKFTNIGGRIVAGPPILHDKLIDLLDLESGSN
jgi:myo-inositol-1(or 4)-monophosphatase